MEIAALTQGNGIASSPVSNGELSEETFLLLLTTQLQHQDPLDPASDVEFIEQMATFASLEQQRLTNSNLGVIQLYQSSLNNSNALGIVGKDVKIQDDQITHESGENHDFFYDSDSQAATVSINVRDSNGKVVYSQTQDGSGDGEQRFTWYGADNSGNDVPPGEYTIDVTLENAQGGKFLSPVYQSKKVRGISYEGGSIQLLVGDKKIPIENVVEVYEGGELTGQAEEAAPGAGFQNPQLNANYQNYQQPFQVIAGGR